MEPCRYEYFRFGFGLGPFNDKAYVKADNAFLAHEVAIYFECKIIVNCTFSQRKVQNELT